MQDEIEIIIASGPDHEELVAEIMVNGRFLALVSQEQGIAKAKVEVPRGDEGMDETAIVRQVSPATLNKGVEMAINKLRS